MTPHCPSLRGTACVVREPRVQLLESEDSDYSSNTKKSSLKYTHQTVWTLKSET